MRERLIFKHAAFKNIPDDQYWRFIIDGVQQADNKELGWQAYNDRESGSVQSLLYTFSFMLDTVDKKPLSEELIKEFHFHLFQVSSINPLQLTAGDYHAPQGGGRTGTFNVFNASNFTPKGLVMLRQKEAEGRLKVIEKGTYGFPTMIQKKFHAPAELSAEVKRIIAHYYSQLEKIKTAEKGKTNQSARLLNIVHCVQDLELLHPFADGNGRTFCTITLNKLLLENGFPPVILADPNRFDGYAPEEMVEEILRGIENFKNIHKMQPSTDDIIAQQIQHDYFTANVAYHRESTGGKSNTVLEENKDPLHWALAIGLTGLFEKMLDIGIKAGIDLNAKNSDSKTILMLAAACGEMDIVKKLLALPGIDVNVQDQWGYTAAMWAAETGHREIMELLSKAKPKIESKLGMTADTIYKIKQEEKSESNGPSNYLFRFCNALANMSGYNFDKYRQLPLSKHYVSRDDKKLLENIASIMNTSQPEKLDPAQLMYLYTDLLKMKCLIPGKQVVLSEIKQKIEKINFKEVSLKCKEDAGLVDLTQFKDFPNYKSLVEFSSKASIVYHYKDSSRLLDALIDDMLRNGFFKSQQEAIDFLFSTPELATVLFPDTHTANEFNNKLHLIFFLDNFRKYTAYYQEKMLHYLLSSPEAVSYIDHNLLLEIGEIFGKRPELQEKLLDVVLKNKDARKACIPDTGTIDDPLIKAFPNHQEKLKQLQGVSSMQLDDRSKMKFA